MQVRLLRDPGLFAELAGPVRVARPGDASLVRDWFAAFHAEATPHEPAGDLAALATRRLAAGEVWLWVDGGRPVSLAAHSAPASQVARIGPVFTPREHRRRGYGAAVTAMATQAALGAGAAHVVLYTDLANPTSNAIYQSIGYLADHDAEQRRFDTPSRGPGPPAGGKPPP